MATGSTTLPPPPAAATASQTAPLVPDEEVERILASGEPVFLKRVLESVKRADDITGYPWWVCVCACGRVRARVCVCVCV